MEKRQPVRRISRGAIGSIAALVLAVSGGAVLWGCDSRPPSTSIPSTQTTNSVKEAVQPKAEIYWLQDKGNNFELVARPVTLDKAAAKNSDAVLEQAFTRLLAGPSSSDSGFSSSIPKGTKVKSVKVENDTVSIDLSQEFTTGGGSASMTGRLAQVIYTATSLNPNAKVFISVDGKRLETLGGEGLEIPQPITRQTFQKDFPL